MNRKQLLTTVLLIFLIILTIYSAINIINSNNSSKLPPTADFSEVSPDTIESLKKGEQLEKLKQGYTNGTNDIYQASLIYNVYTGLFPKEAVNAIKKISKNPLDKFLSDEKLIFKYSPDERWSITKDNKIKPESVEETLLIIEEIVSQFKEK